ncbi:MAG TPA: AmmeMemoRadiSam system radical SAM enzyme [Candidatus Margulisiibacteriota bacterium]|nr:AmmeMemoRadiSam system radical SAM enzyme [Candidatus Margulisiibacteriota bacterium]
MKEALLYDKEDGNSVRCYLCSHHCKIADGDFGFCAVRQNKGGILYAHSYGRVIAAHVDPIEKKPLYHFLPGSRSFSIATIGCNFRCGFCQNWEISQRSFAREDISENALIEPEEIVAEALKNKCLSISYTYTEPTIFFEYALDISKLAEEKGLRNTFITNGYMTREALKVIKPYLDAANVDLKFFREDSYRKICSASLKPVLDSIRYMKDMGVWVEITTLVVPGKNDSEEELGGIVGFIAGVDKDIPWHISRFHPDYKFTGYNSTPEGTLKRAQELGRAAGLTYIYVGNTQGLGDDTICPSCRRALIRREVFSVLEYNIKGGKCPFCNALIPGVFAG